jgi:undecaprenyl-diphosphatase
MNWFDSSIIHFLNQFAQKSWFFDNFVSDIGNNDLLKGGAIATILWWAWFRESETKDKDREIIITAIFMSIVALFFCRGLTLFLPFRDRPMWNTALHFRIPFGAPINILQDWSSFPSDHAVLFFALATSIWLLSRKLGLVACCHALLVVCFPRIYTGVHYPSDIFAGALLGVGFGLLPLNNRIRSVISARPMSWFERSPATFYPSFFLVTFLLGTNFDPLRGIYHSAWHVTTLALRHHI